MYSLGHIAYTMLTGRSYWSDDWKGGPVYPLLLQVLSGVPEPASQRAAKSGIRLPAELDGWFAKATALSPEYRFKRATEMIETLADVLNVSAPTTRRRRKDLDPTADSYSGQVSLPAAASGAVTHEPTTAMQAPQSTVGLPGAMNNGPALREVGAFGPALPQRTASGTQMGIGGSQASGPQPALGSQPGAAASTSSPAGGPPAAMFPQPSQPSISGATQAFPEGVGPSIPTPSQGVGLSSSPYHSLGGRGSATTDPVSGEPWGQKPRVPKQQVVIGAVAIGTLLGGLLLAIAWPRDDKREPAHAAPAKTAVAATHEPVAKPEDEPAPPATASAAPAASEAPSAAPSATPSASVAPSANATIDGDMPPSASAAAAGSTKKFKRPPRSKTPDPVGSSFY